MNLGILAHVDAGKTSLTERLLFAAGAIDTLGRVDEGTTQTDTLELERRRGITIKSAVASFVIGDLAVNLLDTPGHPDFIAEVERVLSVLDGAILVVSAVEGVQAQTRVLMRALQRLGIPTLIFVNKIDRRGADIGRTRHGIVEKLTPNVVMLGSVVRPGTERASFVPHSGTDRAFASELHALLAEGDDALLAAYVAGEDVPFGRLHGVLARHTASGWVYPVFCGSALTGSGVSALSSGIRDLLPSSQEDRDGNVSGAVFKIERGPAGERVAYVRMFAGVLRVRGMVRVGRRDDQRITAIEVFEHGLAKLSPALGAGQIGKVWGLRDVRIGDAIGEARPARVTAFARPTLETAVVPRDPAKRTALFTALTELVEQDPLIGFRLDESRHEMYLSLYGEVQKQIIAATLADEHALDVEFHESTTICIERPVRCGAHVELMGQDGNPFKATVGLRVEPGPRGSGVSFGLEIERGSLPSSFARAVETTVHQTLQQGLHGWEVTDCGVVLTHSDYVPPPPYGWSKYSSSAGDFRSLTPLVLMRALQQAETRVHEPIHRYLLEVPAQSVGTVVPVLAKHRAEPVSIDLSGATAQLRGRIPAAEIHDVQRKLPALTGGEGVLETTFDGYAPVSGTVPPTRPRTDRNPLDRDEYLLRVARRV
ncbi:MAG TPA: translation factor GTPase family protein [Jiangellales bacterium]|nr:translation factor GTPase family protein [Jiangellales bacterium]